MEIAAMEAIPTDQIYETISDVEAKPLKPSFEDIGFDHHLILNNYGTMGFVLVMLPFLYAFHAFSDSCKRCDCWRPKRHKLGKMLYWGTLLRCIIEGYVIGFICCLINLKQLDFSLEHKWTYANSIISCILLPFWLVFPFVTVYLMVKNHKSLAHPSIVRKYGEIMEGYNSDDKLMAVYFSLEYLRKACLALVVVLTTA